MVIPSIEVWMKGLAASRPTFCANMRAELQYRTQ
jgi:hypothetical protein